MAQNLTPEQFAERLEKAGPKVVALMRQRAKAAALTMESRGKANASARLNQPTGTLYRSIAGAVEGGTGRGVDIVLRAGGRTGGKDVPYARIQDQGGTIRPVKAKWLAIPTSEVKTPAGASRYASPRMYPHPLRFMFIFFGLAALVEDTRSGPKARWWLLKKTTIRPKRYLQDAFDETAPEVPGMFADLFETAMRPQPTGGA